MRCWVCGGEPEEFDLLEVLDADNGAEEFLLNLCTACRSGRVEGPPAANRLEKYYSRAYYGEGASKFARPLQAIVNVSAARIARSIRDSLDRPSQARVLDIGCGRGLLLAELSRWGVQGVGLERAVEEPAQFSSSVEIRIGGVRDQEFANSTFDAAILWHALEHLPDPQESLAEVRRILKPGGLLVLAVPNNASWQSRAFGRHWFHLDVPRHLHFFGHAGLTDLVRRHGYRVVKSSTLDPVQNLFGFMQSCLNWLFPASPNRLYQLMRSAQSLPRVLELFAWCLAASILAPVGLIELAWSAYRNCGASSVIFAVKDRGPIPHNVLCGGDSRQEPSRAPAR
jgi:SAM-dependent methyltransferase